MPTPLIFSHSHPVFGQNPAIGEPQPPLFLVSAAKGHPFAGGSKLELHDFCPRALDGRKVRAEHRARTYREIDLIADVLQQLRHDNLGKGQNGDQKLLNYLNYLDHQALPKLPRPAVRKNAVKPQVAKPMAKVAVEKSAAVKLARDVDPQIAQGYRRLGLPLSSATSLEGRTQGHIVGTPRKLGSGAFNTVVQISYKNDPSKYAYKPLRVPNGRTAIERGWVASTTGIDPKNPKIASRNFGTQGVASLLGWDGIVPQTKMAQGPQGELGLAMELVQGKPGNSCPQSVFRDPLVQRDLTKLQLLDAITGQGDRHGGNYLIEMRAGRPVGVKGIDNDQAFGAKVTDPRQLVYGSGRSREGFRGVHLPRVIDREMLAQINKTTPAMLRAKLAGTGLSSQEIEASIQRLAVVKAHVNDSRRCAVIATSEWGGNRAISLLARPDRSIPGTQPYASYIARDGRFIPDWRR